MNRSIEQTLLSLMPTHGSTLPPSLVELAGSLLAQSRHRASTLKADEEVGRLYACAHIACDRLKITLDLPPIEPRPPIPPRIYKRLYSHLDNILPNAALNRTPGKNGTPRHRQRHGIDSPVRTPQRPTPTKERSLAQFRSGNPASGPNTPTKSTGKAVYPSDKSGLHFWIQPTIRFLCKETGQRQLGPTMLAGMEYIVVPGGRRTRDAWVRANLAALCGAVFFFVTQQVKTLKTGEEVGSEAYKPERDRILDLLAKARASVGSRGMDEDEAWEGWAPVTAKEFDDAVQQVTDRGWLEADWYLSLSDIIEAGDVIADSHRRAEGPYRAPVRGADSMFQDRYDFLSEKKRQEYMIWKEGILRRIESLEKEGGEAMEVDV
ncbi:origin recognition complex subunit 6 [Colletotrichum graminicola]|uniref:Origin recognition complex subunit 6 n=1 Tax=Colletotrichum graminicola (strain M1.001 / M2 / FGSC 10212) TaxID=645133 RepID=E3QWH2_COLGM|nr:origin recognition complex subunit 6 [Colletotrichum graminicola M1.001]EFQ35210.1 origin recognition complex subunit 6 [Colletotrichum graminicola M1.001]WDK09986.1 origin recognition complex subunit 6 [Colletotrichum graminicola]